MKFNPVQDFDLLQKALAGEEEAAKMYCGSYKLVMLSQSSGMYRTKELTPTMREIREYAGNPVYDKDGFLHSIFWSLPRI